MAKTDVSKTDTRAAPGRRTPGSGTGQRRRTFHVPFRFAEALRVARYLGLGLMLVLAPAGCIDSGVQFNEQDEFGRTYYIDGAGNWGYGVAEVQQGLRAAGYRGHIVIYGWSPTFNPALDQTVGRPIARLKGEQLGRHINQYCAKYPDQQVNIIALSAGTGVAVWACEKVKSPASVHNLVLLGSSLSARYDMRKALAHVEGGVYVYHSQADMILQGPVRTLGTIDGQLGVDAAGLVGLHPPGGDEGKIKNIRWSREYESCGWTGAHTDATCVPFVRKYIAVHIVPEPARAVSTTSTAQRDHGRNRGHNHAEEMSRGHRPARASYNL